MAISSAKSSRLIGHWGSFIVQAEYANLSYQKKRQSLNMSF